MDSLPSRFDVDVQLRRWLLEILEQCRTEPPFHALFGPAVHVAAAFFSGPVQHDLGVGEVARRENGDEALVGIRNVGCGPVDHGVRTADEGFLDQPHVRVIKNPHAFPLVGLDDEDRVLHAVSN